MHVTQYTRWIAFIRLLRRLGIERHGQSLLAARYEDAWSQHCGLRRDDLKDTLREVIDAGLLRLHFDADGAVLELSELGAGVVAGAPPPLPLPASTLERWRLRLQAEWVLIRIGMRPRGRRALLLSAPQDPNRRRPA